MQTASKIGDDRVIKLLRSVSILVVRNAALEIPHGHMQPASMPSGLIRLHRFDSDRN
jgi:hypothetical protein